MASAPPLIHLEGTTLEGGGQLLRVALGLSTLTKKPINITSIRGNRSRGGGLKAQHLTGVQWLSQASNAQSTGAELKSKELTFIPSTLQISKTESQTETRNVTISQKTPGSVNLVLQAILPYILFSGIHSPMRLTISGGTNLTNSPSIEYITQVLIPMLKHIGIPPIEIQLHSRGWTQGTTVLGSVTYTITPLKTTLPAFQLVQIGDIVSITATIIAPKAIERDFRYALDVMFERRESAFFPTNPPDIEISFQDSHHEKRYYLLLVATTSTGIKLGRDWLYDRRVQPGGVIPAMVKKVSDDLLGEIEHGGCVDEYLRDQLIIFQALADGKSAVSGGKREDRLVEMSLHAKTAAWVVGELLGVQFDDEGTCEGLGFSPGGETAKAEVQEDELAEKIQKLYVSDG
ncbi:hypothetical protein GMOD_00009457 [Pyrenophora seminiperda CCB06]|uniref:RNA 3'-terminal phosphate cyclase domain-containing protein n=1 Tax=Pyrenophora seminiperda CCB06 TaxID=1302712 RepID=A0A3M7MGW5_9PLEO|nr:hypothetical protein GMOD_00009457 [Pyrenophora seminiperda CCB06]